MIRLRTSRPIASVPRRYCGLGAARTPADWIWLGLYGAITLADTAPSPTSTRTSRPKPAPRVPIARPTSVRLPAAQAAPPGRMTTNGVLLAIADTRIQHCVRDVRNQARQRHGQRHDKDDALKHREIAEQD